MAYHLARLRALRRDGYRCQARTRGAPCGERGSLVRVLDVHARVHEDNLMTVCVEHGDHGTY